LSTELPSHPPGAPADIFVTTRWTIVLTAQGQRSRQADVALEELCRVYWYPLYVYVRRRTETREDAEDLTQSFFARFLEKNYLEGITSQKGRFRAFLLISLKHFLANEWDRAHSQKRGGGAATLPLDLQSADTRYHNDPADNLSPDKLYDRAWAITLLEQVIARLRRECATDGRLELFEQLKPVLTEGKGAVDCSRAGAALGIGEGAVRVAIHRFRKRYRELLREEIAQTLFDPAQANEELHALFQAFSNTPSV
jgi:DNA-directed RNA polymerase specialized sigma24 family protein